MWNKEVRNSCINQVQHSICQRRCCSSHPVDASQCWMVPWLYLDKSLLENCWSLHLAILCFRQQSHYHKKNDSRFQHTKDTCCAQMRPSTTFPVLSVLANWYKVREGPFSKRKARIWVQAYSTYLTDWGSCGRYQILRGKGMIFLFLPLLFPEFKCPSYFKGIYFMKSQKSLGSIPLWKMPAFCWATSYSSDPNA